MQGLIARLLLLLFVVSGNFAPLVEAISVPHAHACCLRKLHASSNSPLNISDSTAPERNCCPPITTRPAAQAVYGEAISALVEVSAFEVWPTQFAHHVEFVSTLSARAPPAFS